MYMGNQTFWDQKFSSRKDLLSPEPELVDNLYLLKPGHILDLACGDGRNTMFLLEQAFKVTAVDFSKEALNKLALHARAFEGLNLALIDLESSDAFRDLDKYDSVIINHYRLKKDHLEVIHQLLQRGGRLFVSGFSERHKTDRKIRPSDLIYKSDFLVMDQMTLIKEHHFKDRRGDFVTYVFERK